MLYGERCGDMTGFEIMASATFGLEAVVKREVEDLGYTITESTDGRVAFSGDERAVVRSNLWLRSADRVYIKLAEFEARSFEELFQGAGAVDWGDIVPSDGKTVVVGTSVKSVLHSVPDCQAIIKKAIVNRLCEKYKVEWLEETGAEFVVRFMIHKDRVLLLLDTSGAGLHKRGYRTFDVSAPIKETLAAAMVGLSFYKPGRLLLDPMCGSGTIAIEAAMMARGIAPGLSRSFAAQNWGLIPRELWQEEKKAAFESIDYGADVRIEASDIDGKAVRAAQQNAIEAGVDDCISFRVDNVNKLRREEEYGIIITNPPYGIRIGEQEEMDRIYRSLSVFLHYSPTWSLFLITADKSFEKKMGRPADRRRKLYNGRLETCYYQYHGIK